MLQQLITDNIDLWTNAETKRSTTGRGSNKRIELTGIKKLRELILELAVRGLLVPQDSNDEPASVLLERIATEKSDLIKVGKIRKQKPLPGITADEKPFELPRGWVWERLGNLGYTQTGGTPSKNNPDYFGDDFPFIKPGDIYSERVDYENEGLSDEGAQSLGRIAPSGSILMVCIGTIGKCNSVDRDCTFNQQINAITPLENITDFTLSALRSNSFQSEAWSRSSSTTIAILNKGKWDSILVPIPPIAEQHRIVTKVDELMALCDQLEQKQTQHSETHHTIVTTLLDSLSQAADNTRFQAVWSQLLANFDTLFTTDASIDQLKQTILQLAVMGKLVPQDPNDEPASVLLEKIATEKAQLIKDGKIKKQKALSKITEDEIPFKLPYLWSWQKIGDYALFTEYGLSDKAFDVSEGVPVLKMGDIQNGKVILGNKKRIPDSVESLPALYLEYGDLLYNRTNSAELVGKTGIFLGKSDQYTFASYLIRIKSSKENSLSPYLSLAMQTPLFRETQIVPHLKQQCGQANVNGTIMKNMVVPVAPLAEQYRIVEKVDELMTLCDQLKEHLNQAQTTQQHLAHAIVEQAVA